VYRADESPPVIACGAQANSHAAVRWNAKSFNNRTRISRIECYG